MTQENYSGKVLIISSEESVDLQSKSRKKDRENLTLFLRSVNYEIIELVNASKDTIISNLLSLTSGRNCGS